MTHHTTSATGTGRQRRRRSLGVLVGLSVMLTPMAIAPVAQAEKLHSLGELIDQMLIRGANGPGGPGNHGLGPFLTAVLDAISNIFYNPQPHATRAQIRSHVAHLHD
jgi:hypothetical protein